MSLLRVENLGVEFRNGEGSYVPVTQNVSFSLNEGEVLGLVGESGSGKSVTALSIMKLLPYPKAKNSENSAVWYQGKNLLSGDEEYLQSVRGKEISYIFQEPMSSLNPLHTIGKQLIENIKIHSKISNERAFVKAVKLLQKVGIANAKERMNAYPFELSGGQQQRVMIAMAISNHPKVLIADEPTTALDVTIQAQLIDLLMNLCKEMNMSMIFISHNLRLVEKIANNLCVMQNGKVVEQGVTAQIFACPQHPYTKKLLDSLKVNEKQYSSSQNKILTAQGLEVVYPLKKNWLGKTVKSLIALNSVDLQLFKGETLGIVGESGSGKSTLGLSLSNLLKYNGNIFLNDKNIRDWENRKLRQKLQIVFQDPYNSLNPRMNIEQIIAEGIIMTQPHLNKNERREIVINILHAVEMNEDALIKYPHEFSGGQRQRIAIARALAVQPEIIILDEPTSALDVTIQKQILELLRKLQKEKNLSYIFISHDINAIKTMSDRIAVMKDGNIIEIDEATKILTNPSHDYTNKLIASAL